MPYTQLHPVDTPHIVFNLMYCRGEMSTWQIQVIPPVGLLPRGHGLMVDAIGGQQHLIDYATGQPPVKLISIRGLRKLATLTSQRYGMPVVIDSIRPSTCGVRAKSLFGIYGVYVPPPPPVVAQQHPIAMLREAYAEYRAREAGVTSGTRFGFCTMAECNNIAAGIRLIGERHTAVCKAHEPIPADVVARAVDVVRANRAIPVREVTAYGFSREVFARAAAEGMLHLVKDGANTRWVVTA